MLDIRLQGDEARALRVLCVGAHADDIELGCGATVRALQRQHAALVFDYVVLSGSTARHIEARNAMERMVALRHRGQLVQRQFPDGAFPAAYAEIKAFFESLKAMSPPDVIFCHDRCDRHQDHRLVNEMVWSTFRDHMILEYEVPKWDGGLGDPNVYVPVDAEDVDAKVDALTICYPSQARRDWFSADTFRGLMRLRGIECRAASGYAEAYVGRKLRLF